MADPTQHYQRPSWFTQKIMNGLVVGLTRLGVSLMGSRILRVRGRKSGQWRTTPVNLLVHEGHRYLVAPRGETEWVRNLRAAGEGELVLGRSIKPFRAAELPDSDKPPLLREYLRRWKAETGIFFGGVGSDSPEHELQRIAPKHPVFEIQPTE